MPNEVEIYRAFVQELERKHRTFPRRRGLCMSCYVPHPCSIRQVLDKLARELAGA